MSDEQKMQDLIEGGIYKEEVLYKAMDVLVERTNVLEEELHKMRQEIVRTSGIVSGILRRIGYEKV